MEFLHTGIRYQSIANVSLPWSSLTRLGHIGVALWGEKRSHAIEKWAPRGKLNAAPRKAIKVLVLTKLFQLADHARS